MNASRSEWCALLSRIVSPVFCHLVQGRLRASIPRGREGHGREPFGVLEILGRSLAGVSPWLEHGEPESHALLDQVRQSLTVASDPGSPDVADLAAGPQNVVDAAFLVHGFFRAPHSVWHALPAPTREAWLQALPRVRRHAVPYNNWLLFAAMVETFLAVQGRDWDALRVDLALRKHEEWYLGDGLYGDGPHFHADYYNSYVIQPMLLEVLRQIGRVTDRWDHLRQTVETRARRYAAQQERQINRDGTFPVLGRSIVYRSGAFQHLAQCALDGVFPVPPAQVRCALTAVHRACFTPPGTFDAGGWLNVGLAGHQPSLAETYISTPSLYLCTGSFLPLGLPAEHAFWSDPDLPWTAVRAWSGEDLPADHAED